MSDPWRLYVEAADAFLAAPSRETRTRLLWCYECWARDYLGDDRAVAEEVGALRERAQRMMGGVG